MGLISTYLKNKLSDHVLRGLSYPAPEKAWVALYADDQEIIGDGYQREYAKFDAPIDGICKNAENIIFHKAKSVWPEITGVALFDAENGGSQLFYGKTINPIGVAIGKNFYIKIGKLQAGFGSKKEV